ncbi:ABC transporter permease [Brevibacillus brevis]|uniref:ABC transporter permease n=1 Tax=Brevibacillus brevis TaxID=1393 RepID=A0A517IDD7_BREBE|nr:ABC transporter permease [Brevibacillus brevis]
MDRTFFSFKDLFKKLSFQHQESGEKLKLEGRNVGELHEHRDYEGETLFRCCAIFYDYFVI